MLTLIMWHRFSENENEAVEAHVHDIDIPRPKNHDTEIPRLKSHDTNFQRNSDPYGS